MSEKINGNVTVGNNLAVGGDAVVQGGITVGHNIKVEGWLEAPNIKDINKGVFTSVAALNEAYPSPKRGWIAGVLDSENVVHNEGEADEYTTTEYFITLYVVDNGAWEATSDKMEFGTDITNVLSNMGVYVCVAEGNVMNKVVQKVIGVDTYSDLDFTPQDGVPFVVQFAHAHTEPVPEVNLVRLSVGTRSSIVLRYEGDYVSPTNTWEDGEYVQVFFDSYNLEFRAYSLKGVSRFNTGEAVRDLGIDTVATDGSSNLVTSDAVWHAINDNDVIDTSQVKDSAIITEKIADGAITNEKISDGVVTTEKLADTAVTTAKIADRNVTTDKIEDLNVTTPKIADGAVTTAKIADNNVTSGKIADGAVIAEKIADGSVTTSKIPDSNITTQKIADLGVTTDKIADHNVTRGKLADNAVATTKIVDNSVTWNKLDHSTQNVILSVEAGGLHLATEFGDSEDLGITQKKLTEAHDDLQNQINEIVAGDTTVTLTSTKTVVFVNATNTFNLTATSSRTASKIVIRQGTTELTNGENISSLTASSVSITPVATGTTTYTADFTISGVERSTTRGITAVYPIYVGKADAYNDIISDTYKQSARTSPAGTYTVNSAMLQYVWFVIPATMSINSATMSGFNFPLESPVTVQIDGVNYKVYQSSSKQQANIDLVIVVS